MKILEGIRVLDWTVLQQGPVCSTLLSDLGADVIKMEQPDSGDLGRYCDNLFGIDGRLPNGSNYYFELCNRGKRGLTLDLKSGQGREIFYRLIKTCDVFVQNFRVGVAEKVGVDYHTLQTINPRLIYTHATGMGGLGEDAGKPLIDSGGLARSGLMWEIGDPGPTPASVQGALCDQSGAIFAAYGTLAALYLRERTGKGQLVESSLLGGAIGLNWISTSIAGWSRQNLPRIDRKNPSTPLYNYYCCKDGKWISIGSYMERYFAPFYRLAGRPDIPDDPRFASPEERAKHNEELTAITAQIFLQKTRSEWAKLLREAEMIYEPVNHISELMEDEQAFANGYLTHYHHPRFDRNIVTIGSPVRFSDSPAEIQGPAPMLGEHNGEILTELGYTTEEIRGFQEKHVI